jgi:exo-1,4-beta-D-glucosaminidase
VTNNAISDARDIIFGIRKIEAYVNDAGYKGFKLNGKEVLIKGAGWTDDIFLRETKESNEIQVEYMKHMNLNTVRFENIWGTSQNIYDLCDRYGIMVMVGWSCQWEWDNYLGKSTDEYGGIKSDEDIELIIESLGDQIRYLQHHPSIFVWLVGSDKIPRPALEKKYRDLILGIDNRPYLASASTRTSEVSGPTGVKMNGPYEYVGPNYWYLDSVNGGAYGFNTETGPGPQIPVKETILRMIPANKLWPVNEIWNYHCNPSSEAFNSLDVFSKALQQRYGWPISLDNFLLKSDAQSYEAMKGMFEAFRANSPNTTGIIQWMLNSAWPSFYWQLYDYYLLPTAAYYAARKANAPVQLIYNYGNNNLYAVNETLKRYEKAKARIRLLDIQSREIISEELIITLDENISTRIFKIPPISGNMFLSLSLLDEQNTLIADNFYWLSG